MQEYTFVFFGIVGSGKGTQIELLTNFFKSKYSIDTVYAYPGSEYRKLTEGGNYTGSLLLESLNRGELQPDFLTNAIVVNILSSSLTKDKALIFDGYPRTIIQSEILEQIIEFYNRKNVNIVYIKLSEEEAMKRNMLRGRSDDTKEGLKRRIQEYINNVIPAMDYLKNKNKYTIHTINGEQSIEDVHSDIIKSLELK